MYTIEGKNFETLVDVSNHYKIKYDTLLARVRRGWTLEQAVNLVPRKIKKESINTNEITINNVKYKSRAEAMRELNLNRYEINRLLQTGNAKATYPNRKKIKVMINGEEVIYNSIRQFCKDFNLCYVNFCAKYKEDENAAQEVVDKFYE